MKQKIYYLIIKILSSLIPIKVLNKLELILQNSLGKGISISMESEVNSVRKFLKEDVKIIFDIGANYGVYTDELLKHYPNAKYFLFEPSKFLYNHLKTKYKNFSNVKIFNYAVSNKKTISKLYYDNLGSGLASLNKRNLNHFKIKFDKYEKISTISLIDLFKDNFKDKSFMIDFCKIDIEGHEYEVLKSIKSYFYKFKVIQFEFGDANIDSKTYFQNFWDLLHNDYNIYRIAPTTPIQIKEYSEVDEVFIMTNFIAVNKLII